MVNAPPPVPDRCPSTFTTPRSHSALDPSWTRLLRKRCLASGAGNYVTGIHHSPSPVMEDQQRCLLWATGDHRGGYKCQNRRLPLLVAFLPPIIHPTPVDATLFTRSNIIVTLPSDLTSQCPFLLRTPPPCPHFALSPFRHGEISRPLGRRGTPDPASVGARLVRRRVIGRGDSAKTDQWNIETSSRSLKHHIPLAYGCLQSCGFAGACRSVNES